MDVTLQLEGIDIGILDGPYLWDGKPTKEAIACYTALVASIPALRQYVAQLLLPLYNDVWFDEDVGELDEHSFMQRLTPSSILLYDELGTAVVYFKDGDIFGGHGIEVSTENGVPCDAQLIG